MQKSFKPVLFFLAIWLVLIQFTVRAQVTNLVWREAQTLTVEGRGWSDTKLFYDRLPAHAEGRVREVIWNLSRNSAGISVRFISDSTEIGVRWNLRNTNLALPHMPASGASGVDLYVKEDGRWHWLGAGRPAKSQEEQSLVRGLPPGRREFIVNLPLYNGVTEVGVGVLPGATLEPLVRSEPKKPIVFYGTSILHGGCASRPGMAYPAILGRHLDWPIINLGFSGNAFSEPEMATLLAELDPALYVLDPLPNMSPEMVAERMEPFVKILRAAHPKTPILLVENATYPNVAFLPGRAKRVRDVNTQLRAAYDRLRQADVKSLYYFKGDKLFGTDGEGTVDGTHPTDLGFTRMADAMEPTLKRLLRGQR